VVISYIVGIPTLTSSSGMVGLCNIEVGLEGNEVQNGR